MATLYLDTPEGVDLHREIAGPGGRSAAAILDVLILATLWFSLLVALSAAASVDLLGASGFALGLVVGGGIMFVVLYPAVSALLLDGRTLGKLALGLRVVGDEGYPAEPVQHLLRSLLWPIELALWIPAPIGLVAIATTPRRQRLGDLVAGTVVVREPRLAAIDRVEPFGDRTWSGLPEHTLALSAAVVEPLDSEDVELLRALLARRRLPPEVRRRLFVETARHYSVRLGLGPFDDARVFLRELYLFLRERRRT
jgi:uncharacterized RDD family membrane protein YckC